MHDLDEAIGHWKKLAPQLSFLGEIALSETQTATYLHALSSHLKEQDSYNNFATPISVLAVNCAYYHYDDNGFWHFFCKSLRLDCNPAVQSGIGNVIENYLRSLRGKNFEKRSGPFRYVGRILEECGVSQYYMSQFVDFIKLLKTHGSCDIVSNLSYIDYKKCIPCDLSKFLHSFLADISGWHFVTDVANSLSQYERNLIGPDNLCLLPGYRPNFWADFLRYFDGTSITTNFEPRSSQSSFEQQISPPHIYWPDKPPISPPFVTDHHVYMSPFGNIAIGNFKSVQAGRYIVVYSVAGKTNLVPLESFELSASNVALLDLNELFEAPPCELELWFEIAGRSSGTKCERQIGKWVFVFIDKIDFETCPEKLLTPEESVHVALHSPQGYRLKFSQPATSKEQGKKWIIPCNVSKMRGEIVNGELVIPFEIPIYRDMLRLESGSKLLLSSQKDFEENLLIEGYPGSKLELCIKSNTQNVSIETGTRFGGNGTIKLNIKSTIGAELESWQEGWGLLSQGTDTLEGCVIYLNLPIFISNLSEIWSYPNEFFFALPTEWAKSFRELANALSRQHHNFFDVKIISTFPQKIQNIAWILASCAYVFDGARIHNLDMQNEQILQNIPAETRKTLLWYLAAKKVNTDENPEQLASLIEASFDPKAVYSLRWVDKVRLECQRISRLNTLCTDLGRHIIEWLAQVTGNARTTYSGMIANLPGGRDLTTAWRQFIDHQFTNSYSSAHKLERELGVVGALARILQLVILKESGRKQLMVNVDTVHIPTELLPVVKGLLSDTTDDGISILAKYFS
ncbi:hypothetical protein ACUZ9P_01920 [Desulfovibrio sp. QI0430]